MTQTVSHISEPAKTHYIPAFTRTSRDGAALPEAVCGLFVEPASQVTEDAEPTCALCRQWLADIEVPSCS